MSKSSAPKTLSIIGICILLILAPSKVYAAQVRGRVQRVYPNGVVGPVAGVPVTVFNQQVGRSVAFYTDQSGMYYMAIPAGVYYLEVWTVQGGQPLVYGPFSVNEPGTDIPPVNA